jgi:hypothetical protein
VACDEEIIRMKFLIEWKQYNCIYILSIYLYILHNIYVLFSKLKLSKGQFKVTALFLKI